MARNRNNSLVTRIIYLVVITSVRPSHAWNESDLYCPFMKNIRGLDLKDLVGNWMTVYSQPRAVSCFTLSIRATTELEQESCEMKYGDFNGRVNWAKCRLELESPLGKHYLQGTGRYAGVLENIIIATTEDGDYYLVDQTADQWAVYGRRGSELLLMRDCSGEAVAVFARSPFWPSSSELYSVLHRTGIPPLAERVLCLAYNQPDARCSVSTFISDVRQDINHNYN